MARKRKTPTSQQPPEQKPKIVKEEEEEVEDSSDDEEEEQSESGSDSDSGSGSESESESDEEEESSSSEEEDESNDDASKTENLRELLEPFDKNQIINLVKEAAAKDPTLLAKVVQLADADPIHRKIFIHGLGYDATPEQLLQVFKPYGEIEDSKLVTDKLTGRAKGYAFVLFKTRASAKKALKIPQKKIGSRMVSCQLAAIGPGAAANEGGGRKIYVGNVGPHVSPDKLKAFFAKFGELEDAPIGLDPATNKFRGFAVITYKSPEGFGKALEEPVKVFENCQMHCKKFVEYDKNNKNNNVAAGQMSAGNVNPGVTDFGYGGGMGMNPGMLGANLSMMAQNPGMGLPGGNPLLAAAGYNPAGLSTPIVGMGGNYGMNSVGSGVMGSYGAQAALQGLGAFQNPQTRQFSIGTAATTTTATKAPTSGASSAIPFSSYFNR